MTDQILIGLLGFLGLFVLMALGVPIGLCLFGVGLTGMVLIIGLPQTLNLIGRLPYYSTASWAYVVLPMFMLMGNFAFSAGMGDEVYHAAEAWLSRTRGGLVMATTAACTAFAFASGSSIATSAMFTRMSLPAMAARNYDKKLSCGCIAASGTLAALIPPSGVMVVYVVFAEHVSLGKLMMSGIMPGLLTAALFLLVTFLWTHFRPEAAPFGDEPVLSIKQKVYRLKGIVSIAIIVVLVLGGIYLGVFTPTEAGALGAFFTLIIFLVRKGFNVKTIAKAVVDAVSSTGMIFLIVIGALTFARFIALSGLVNIFSKVMLSLPVAPVIVVIVMLLIYLVLGTFLDAVGMLALTLPIFLPVIAKLGVNGIWFAILVIMLLEIGNLTPPVGLNVYAVKAAAGDYVSMEDVFSGILPFFLAYLVAVALIIGFPQIALWLPTQMLGK